MHGDLTSEAVFQAKTVQAAERDRPDFAMRRATSKHNQPAIDGRRLIFIDETLGKTNMTRVRSHVPRGQRLIEMTPRLATNIADKRYGRFEIALV